MSGNHLCVQIIPGIRTLNRQKLTQSLRKSTQERLTDQFRETYRRLSFTNLKSVKNNWQIFFGIMASFANPCNNYSYTRSIFEHPSKWYDSYQENGTKYLKSRKQLDEVLQLKLNACAGEIYLSGIPGETRAEQIADIASLLGEVYILRFKVNFSGDSRGFAYLQYTNPSLMQLALCRLPTLFRQYSLHMIRVRESRNSSKLLLKKTYGMSPDKVFETLQNLINFDQLVGREIYTGYFEYQIVFKCNEEAVHARRDLLRTITKFGRNAVIVWDTPSHIHNSDEPTLDYLQNRNKAAHRGNSLIMVPNVKNFGNVLNPNQPISKSTTLSSADMVNSSAMYFTHLTGISGGQSHSLSGQMFSSQISNGNTF